MSNQKVTLEFLKSHLWKAADILRGSLDASEYRQPVMTILFLKRLNDRFEENVENLKKQGKSEKEAKQDFRHDFFVPEEAKWEILSQVTDVYWIYAENNVVPYPEDTERSGKWLIFVPNDKIDEVWMTIKKATEEGLLGKYSKVATAIPNPNAPTPKNKVICVYTYDHDDRKDVMRIRDELRKMGFTSKIPYKADKATLENK